MWEMSLKIEILIFWNSNLIKILNNNYTHTAETSKNSKYNIETVKRLA